MRKVAFIFSLLFCFAFMAKAQVLPGNLPDNLSIAVSNSSGNWNDSNTWTWLVNNGNVQGQLPYPNDSTFVIIQSGHTVTLASNSKCESMVVEANATLDNSTYELKLQFMGWAHPINDIDFDDGVPYLSYAPLDNTWSIYSANNAHWTMYKIDGTHTGSGNTIFDWDDGIDRDEFGATVTGDGQVTGNGTLYYRSSGSVQRGLKFNSACNLQLYVDLSLTDDEYPVNGGGALTAVNYGSINLLGTANMVAGAQFGIFYNYAGGTITLANGSLYLAPLTAYTALLFNFGEVTIQNGNLYFSTASYIQTDGGSIDVNGDVLGQDLDSYFLQGAGSVLSVTGAFFPSGNPGRFISMESPNYVVYDGTAPQEILCPVDPDNYVTPGPYSILSINNPQGTFLTTDISVNDSLVLTDGLVAIDVFNLMLNQNAGIGGTPSSSGMVVATGSGELRKVFAEPASFTFPVGDSDGTTEYSPVSITITSATFTDAYMGVNLVNQAYPGVSGSYINRYWNITSSGFGNLLCDAQFNYVVDDVTGDENIIYCHRVAPTTDVYEVTNTTLHQLSADELESMGTFTGRQPDNMPPPIAFEVTGGGIYCAGDDGLPVGLSGSEANAQYTLYKDNVAQTPVISGTGSPISFGNQYEGVYTVVGDNIFGSTPMIGEAVVIEDTVVSPAATIFTSSNSVCEGNEITFTSVVSGGGSNPVYEWRVNEVITGGNTPELTYTPEDSDEIYLVFTSSSSCAIDNPVISNSIIVTVNPLPQVSWSGFEPDTLCMEDWDPVLLYGGSPDGGSYYGDGVFDNIFYPVQAGYGDHLITYTYVDAMGCSSEASLVLFVDECTGTFENRSEVLIYPNPAHDFLVVEFAGNVPVLQLTITDLLGLTCYQSFPMKDQKSITIPMHGKPAGTYLLRIAYKTRATYHKVILR